MGLVLVLAQWGYWQDASQGDFLGGREAFWAGSQLVEAGLGVNWWASERGLRILGQDYDLNDDGATDLTVFGAGASDARIVYGPGFSSDLRFSTHSAEGMGVADLDADGVPEVIIAEQNSPFSSYIYWDLNPSSRTNLNFGDNGYGAAVGDLNLDGYPDVVLAGNGTANAIFWGPSYTSRTDFGSGEYWDPFVADLNLDGYPDVVVAEADSGGEIWWGPSFTSKTTLSFSKVKAVSVADLNADGAPDVVIGSYGGSVRIFWGPNFSSSQTLTLANVQDVEVADLDGDGNLDVLACSGLGGVVRIWWGPSFTSYTDLAASTGDGVDALDFDNDGDLDVANSYGSDAVRIYANQGSRSFALWQTVSLAGWFGSYADLRKYEEPGDAYTRQMTFEYLSRAFTGPSTYTLDSVRWWASVPSGLSLKVYVRASDDSANWSGWVEVQNGGLITDPQLQCRKYYQYRVELASDARATSAFHLDSIRLYYYDCAYGVREGVPKDWVDVRGPFVLVNVVGKPRRLSLYSPSGRLLASWELSPGVHRLRWAEGLKPGVYILALEGARAVKAVLGP